MAKIYAPKLTEAQYFHVMNAMNSYGVDVNEKAEETLLEGNVNLHNQTLEALNKAQEEK